MFFKLLIFSIVLPVQTLAAACCGGGFSAPAIIAGDNESQLSSSLSMTEIAIDNVDSEGVWRQSEKHQNIQTLKIEAAHVFWDRYQAGLSVPMIKRNRDGESFSGLGDISGTFGYEYLPDWNYNPYRPKGIGFIQLIVPTGKAKAESENGGLDSRGNGFWAIGIGTLLTKTWTRFDSFLSLEAHHSKEKVVSNSQLEGRLEPGYGGNFALGLGYNLKDFRLGSGVTWTYEDPIKISTKSGAGSDGLLERYATTSLSLSYLQDEEWSGTITYTDQTLVGSPVNTSLGRGINLQFQRLWSR